MSFLQPILESARELRADSIHLQDGSEPLFYRRGMLETAALPAIEPGQLSDLIGSDGQLCFFEGGGLFRVRVSRLPFAIAVRLTSLFVPPHLSNLLNFHELSQTVFESKRLILVAGHPYSLVYSLWSALFDNLNATSKSGLVSLDRIKHMHLHKKSMVCQRDYPTDFQDWSQAIELAVRSGCDGLAVSDLSGKRTVESLLKSADGNRWVLGLVTAANPSRAVCELFRLIPSSRHRYLGTAITNCLGCVVWVSERGIEVYKPDSQCRSKFSAKLADLGALVQRWSWQQ